MGWLEREWREIVKMMGRRVGPQRRPFGEIWAYVLLLGMATIWLIFRWSWVSSFR